MAKKWDHYLTPEQMEYFRGKLLNWKNELLKESSDIRERLVDDKPIEADPFDSASNIANQALDLRTRDRMRKLIHKIDQAIERINDGSYGYCEETGDPIGLKRLEARPIATLCIQAQERHEKKERDYRDDD